MFVAKLSGPCFKNFNLVRSITQIVFTVCGYNILLKFVNQLIASSIQIIQIDSRHLLSYYMPNSLVYYYTGVFCDIWTLLFICKFVFFLAFLVIYKHLFSNCFWNVRFPKQMMWKNTGNLRISRFYDITHETVVTPSTDFGILRKYSIIFFGSGYPIYLFHLFAW